MSEKLIKIPIVGKIVDDSVLGNKVVYNEKRTLTQNAALHLFFQLVADALNDAGYSIQEVLKNFTMDCEWTKESVKEILWKTAQKRMLKKNSTTQLDKGKEIDLIYDVLNRFLGEKLHIENIPFPSEEQIEIAYPTEEVKEITFE